MEVHASQLELQGAWIGGRALDVSSSSTTSRYHVDLPVDPDVRRGSRTIDLCLVDAHGAQTRAKIALARSRRLQTHGYEAIDLICEGHSASWEIRAYRVLHAGKDVTVILSTPAASDFMAQLPDSLTIGDLTLPGTHESCAFYGGPISQCQQSSTTLLSQLEDGIRFLDVRIKVVGDQLLAYHGPQSQHIDFLSILQIIHLFLQSHSTETLIMSIKEEIPPFHPLFSAMVERDLSTYRGDWILDNRIPTLGEARGKAILFSRFERVQEKEWPDGIGIHPGPWPDSKPWVFEWDCSGTKVRVQDWYRLNSFLQIPEKVKVVIDSLQPCAREKSSPHAPFTLSFTTASGVPLGLPTLMAKGFGWPSWGLGVRGINSRLCEWLLQCICDGKQVRACLPMDFYRQTGEVDQDLAAILVAMNFL